MNNNSDQKLIWDGLDRRNFAPASKTPSKMYYIAVVAAAAIFAFDLLTPLGVAGGVPYVALVLFGWLFKERPAVLFLATGASVLTIVGYLYSSEGVVSWVVLTNRAYAILAIWATAAMLWWGWRDRASGAYSLMSGQVQGQKVISLMGRESAFVAVLSIVIVASSWGVMSRIEGGAKADIGKSLRTTLDTTHASIRHQMESHKKTAKIWADNFQVQRNIAELTDMPNTQAALINSRAQNNLRMMVKSLFSTVGYRGYFVIGENNINLASSRNNNIGLVNLLARQGNFLDRVWAGETLVSLPQKSDVPLKDFDGEMIAGLATMFVATPVKSARGKTMAILAFRLDPAESLSPVLQRGYFGDSGESYAFDVNGLMLSESRFNDELRKIGLIGAAKHSILNIEIRDPGINIVLGHKPILPRDKQPLTHMAESATSGQNGLNLDGYRDYRGVPVVGAWLWDAELGFGITTEIDVAEAFVTLNNVRFFIFVFSALSIGVLVILAVVSSRTRNQIVLSEKKYRNVINSTLEGYVKIDPIGRLLEVNKACCEMLGYQPEEILGKRLYEFATGENRVYFKQQISEATTSAQHQYDVVLENKQGNAVHAHVSATSIMDSRGNPTGAFAFFTNITERKKAEKELEESREWLGALADNLPEFISLKDVEGRFKYVNRRFEEWTGFNYDDVVGKTVHEIYSPEQAKRFSDDDSKALNSGNIFAQEIALDYPDGRTRTVISTRFPIKSRFGGLIGLGTINYDISDRKAAEQKFRESEELLSTAINNISDGFVLCDVDNRIVLFNSRFKALYPNSRDLIQKGALFEDFIRGGAERGEYPDAIDRIDEWVGERKTMGREHSASFDQQLVGGRWLQISVGRLPDGGWVGIHVDITAIKEAMESADKANLAKSEFLSAMSHELRTPMNAILGFAQMLDYNPKEPLSKLQKESVDHILKGGQHLLELINDILDLARIEAGRVELSIENISPMKILDECLSLITNMAEERGIEISTPEPGEEVPAVLADHTRFKQVLLNLMSNAVKYNRENGTVFIQFEKTTGANLEAAAGAMLRISVTDTGAGIPEEKQIELFKPFSRLGAENSEIEGTGIGLVVCKDLVDLMNGAVGMQSEVGKGSSFWFELPLAEAAHGGTRSSPEDLTEELISDVSGTLLYVEDNPDNLKLMELIVARMEGMAMISTHTGELGIELARAEKPELIILDINLPGMNGIETLKKLQIHESTRNIPVLALSAAATARDIEKGMEAGFLRYLTKPILVPEVMEAIQTVMKETQSD
jgi:PAS domain S-box-containing protein